MSFLGSLTLRLTQFLALYGGWGLFALSFLDASFLSLPLANDLLLIHLAGQAPERALVYAIQSAAGSVLGYLTLYGLARGAGDLARHGHPPHSRRRVAQWLEQNAFVAILVASLLPPPVPFKLFVISAGVFRVNVVRFGLGLLLGRSLRFAAEAMMGVHFGARAEAYFKQNIGWALLALSGFIISVTFLYHSYRPGQLPPAERGEPTSDPDRG